MQVGTLRRLARPNPNPDPDPDANSDPDPDPNPRPNSDPNPDPNPDQLEMVGFVPVLLYFGYMMMVALLFFLGAGTIGFLSSWWFVWKIYGAVKVD